MGCFGHQKSSHVLREGEKEVFGEEFEQLDERAFAELVNLLRGRRFVLLTGAGCSTESGIPDYRGPESIKKPRNPILYQEFVGSEEARSRYWARSSVGWPRFVKAQPNETHTAMAVLEEAGHAIGMITQNVDRLHHKAGSKRIVELHGALAEVRCLDCGEMEAREALQHRLLENNPVALEPAGEAAMTPELAPDGDAVLSLAQTTGYVVPPCLHCGGMLKPNVVFFGENVEKSIVDAAWSMLDEADVLLVVGSSLTVFSGYRFVLGAEKRSIPVAIVNIGETRGDRHADVLLQARCSLAMARLAEVL